MTVEEHVDADHRGGPLAGVRVLDFTRILSGPYCTLLLADLGAEVVKVERPRTGDDTRWWGPPFLDEEEGISTYFASLNRGKRSIALDLAHPRARDLLHRLVGTVDVVVENFRPGVAERYGLSYEALRAVNPRLVVCSISGYGHEGTYADYPGTEIVVEGMSGLMSVTGPREGDPVRFGIAMVDIATGLTAATRITAALMRARETGAGGHVHSSLYSTALAALGTLITSYTATKEEPERWGSHHPSIVPYGGFLTADGYLITGVVNDTMWPAFCEALDLPELAARSDLATNAGRVARREEVEAFIAAKCATRGTRHWMRRLRERRLLAAPVRTVGEAVSDPATRELGLMVGLDGFPGVLAPRLDGERAGGQPPMPVPRLGADTREVLRDLLGASDDAVEELLTTGVVADTGRASLARRRTVEREGETAHDE